MPRRESEDIAYAFFHGKPCKRKRTVCTGDTVELFGNRIAWRDDDGNVWLSLCGWGTVTTRDRLNAICEMFDRGRPFSQMRGEQYFDGEPVRAAIPLLGPLGVMAARAEARIARERLARIR